MTAVALATATALSLPASAESEGKDHGARMMERLDTNKDGVIDRTEFMAARDDKFASMDGDGDGAITEAELEAAIARFHDEHGTDSGGKHRGPDFGRLDADGDGAVTRTEFDDAAERMFARFDRNGDGVLSPEDRKDHDAG
jgi:Ca2+-binding EF-hand superfamily protein